MDLHASRFVGLVLGWQATGIGLAAAGDDVLESRMAECRDANDGDCFLRLSAFSEAVFAFEQTAHWDRAARLRAQLGQSERAYTDALAFVKASDDSAAKRTVADEVLAQGGLRGADGEAELIDFYRRYLRDFSPYASKDSVLVSHARLGALLMARSCPIHTFHGGCVVGHREKRNCPNLCDEHGRCRGPVFQPAKPDDGTYSVEIAVGRPRDSRLVSEATQHLRAVLESRDFAAAEESAASSPDRARALANARAMAAFARALPDLDRFLGLGGVPEDLDFKLPSQLDSRCEALRKTAAYNYSSHKFTRWLREKLALMGRLRETYLMAATDSGPEAVVVAMALYSFVMESTSRALLAPDDQLYRCPIAGFIHPPSDRWAGDVDHATSLCDLLANRYAIDTEQSRYCRIALSRQAPVGPLPCPIRTGRRRCPGDDVGAARLLLEISPSSLFMDRVRDDEEAPSSQSPMSTAPARDRPKPPSVRCSTKSGSGTPRFGALQMTDGADLADFFGEHPRFPATLPDQLAERFPPPLAK